MAVNDGRIGKNFGFLRSLIGILKLVQFGLSLLILIIVSATNFWGAAGLGPINFVMFAGSFATVTVLISIFIHLFKLYNLPLVSRLPWKRVEFGYDILCAILYFIAMAISGWGAQDRKKYVGDLDKSFTAAAIFCAITMIVFIACAVFTFRGDHYTVRKTEAAEVQT